MLCSLRSAGTALSDSSCVLSSLLFLPSRAHRDGDLPTVSPDEMVRNASIPWRPCGCIRPRTILECLVSLITAPPYCSLLFASTTVWILYTQPCNRNTWSHPTLALTTSHPAPIRAPALRRLLGSFRRPAYFPAANRPWSCIHAPR